MSSQNLSNIHQFEAAIWNIRFNRGESWGIDLSKKFIARKTFTEADGPWIKAIEEDMNIALALKEEVTAALPNISKPKQTEIRAKLEVLERVKVAFDRITMTPTGCDPTIKQVFDKLVDTYKDFRTLKGDFYEKCMKHKQFFIFEKHLVLDIITRPIERLQPSIKLLEQLEQMIGKNLKDESGEIAHMQAYMKQVHDSKTKLKEVYDNVDDAPIALINDTPENLFSSSDTFFNHPNAQGKFITLCTYQQLMQQRYIVIKELYGNSIYEAPIVPMDCNLETLISSPRALLVDNPGEIEKFERLFEYCCGMLLQAELDSYPDEVKDALAAFATDKLKRALALYDSEATSKRPQDQVEVPETLHDAVNSGNIEGAIAIIEHGGHIKEEDLLPNDLNPLSTVNLVLSSMIKNKATEVQQESEQPEPSQDLSQLSPLRQMWLEAWLYDRMDLLFAKISDGIDRRNAEIDEWRERCDSDQLSTKTNMTGDSAAPSSDL